MSPRNDKFLRIYCLFELLGGKPDTSWRAVRVSISHSSRKITEKKLVDCLLSNFGELKISYKNHHQVKLFYKLFTELVDATYQEILRSLKNPSVIQDDWAEKIIKIIKSRRLKFFEPRNNSEPSYYDEFVSELRLQIPYNFNAYRIRYVLDKIEEKH